MIIAVIAKDNGGWIHAADTTQMKQGHNFVAFRARFLSAQNKPVYAPGLQIEFNFSSFKNNSHTIFIHLHMLVNNFLKSLSELRKSIFITFC